MSENAVVVRVLLTYKVYEKLKKESQLYQEHLLKKRNTLLQSGGGNSIDCSNSDQVSVIPTTSTENIDQREAIVTEKCTELDGVTKVNIKNVEEEKIEVEKLSDSQILQSIWSRFKTKAEKLLKQFHSYPTRINWDSSGIVTLNGEKYSDVNIKDLLAISFYPIRTKKVLCLSIFIELLKELNLMIFVKNFEIRYEQ